MKWNKFLALLLVIAMAMTMLVACGGNDDDDDDDSDKAKASDSVKDDDKKEEEEEEEKAPKELTEDYLIGTWVATYDAGEMLEEEVGFTLELPIKVTLKFEKNGEFSMEGKADFDEDDLAKQMKKLFEDEKFLKDTLDVTKEEFEEALEQSGMDLDDLIDEAVSDMDVSDMEEDFTDDGGEWALEDGELSVDGYDWPGEYKNGVLTMEMEDLDIKFEFKKK